MKKFLIVMVILIALAAGLVGFAIYNTNKIVSAYKGQIEELASSAIGTRVALGEVNVSGFPGVSLKVSELAIGEKSETSLKDFRLDLELLPLLSKRLEIKRLYLEKPSLLVIKDNQGVRLAGMPFKAKKDRGENRGGGDVKESKPAQAASSPLDIELKRIEIADADLSFEDRTAGKTHRISALNLSTQISLKGDRITLDSTAISGRAPEEIVFKAHAPELILSPTSASAPKLEVELSGSKYNLSGKVEVAAKASLEGPQSFNVAVTAAPRNLALSSKDMAVSEINGTIELKAAGERIDMRSADLALKFNGSPVTVAINSNLTGQKFTLEELKLGLFGGEITAAADLQLTARKEFTSNVVLSALSIEQALSALKPKEPAKLAGKIERISARLSGSLENPKGTAHGPVSIDIRDGVLKDVNLAGTVLKAVNGLPMLTGALYGSVPGSEKAAVDSPDTAFRSITGNLQIANQHIATKDLLVDAPIFSLDASGRIGFDSDLDLNANITFSEAFSGSLVKATKELRSILNDQGRISFPLSITGIPPKIIVVPNIKRLIEMAAKGVIKNKAGELLEGLLNKKGSGGGKKGGLEGLLGF
ncbi:MAG: hypothetical protein DCC75_04970 [Proteobacteria bacterium]|nr:MAG: hypothetical protein DCC75_04970 [Pseudomonadota bacterium]